MTENIDVHAELTTSENELSQWHLMSRTRGQGGREQSVASGKRSGPDEPFHFSAEVAEVKQVSSACAASAFEADRSEIEPEGSQPRRRKMSRRGPPGEDSVSPSRMADRARSPRGRSEPLGRFGGRALSPRSASPYEGTRSLKNQIAEIEEGTPAGRATSRQGARSPGGAVRALSTRSDPAGLPSPPDLASLVKSATGSSYSPVRGTPVRGGNRSSSPRALEDHGALLSSAIRASHAPKNFTTVTPVRPAHSVPVPNGPSLQGTPDSSPETQQTNTVPLEPGTIAAETRMKVWKAGDELPRPPNLGTMVLAASVGETTIADGLPPPPNLKLEIGQFSGQRALPPAPEGLPVTFGPSPPVTAGAPSTSGENLSVAISPGTQPIDGRHPQTITISFDEAWETVARMRQAVQQSWVEGEQTARDTALAEMGAMGTDSPGLRGRIGPSPK